MLTKTPPRSLHCFHLTDKETEAQGLLGQSRTVSSAERITAQVSRAAGTFSVCPLPVQACESVLWQLQSWALSVQSFILLSVLGPVCALWGPRPCRALQSWGAVSAQHLQVMWEEMPEASPCDLDSSAQSAEEPGCWPPAPRAGWTFMFPNVPSACGTCGGPGLGKGRLLSQAPAESSLLAR